MNKKPYHIGQSLLLLITAFIISVSYYLQFAKGLEPCPLCVMQRICAFIFGMFCLMGMVLSTLKRAKLIAVIQYIFAFLGLLFATRQIWLQFFSTGNTTACLPNLEVLFRYFPWQDILTALFWGSGECARISWRLLWLPISVWSFLYFLSMCVLSIVFYKKLRLL